MSSTTPNTANHITPIIRILRYKTGLDMKQYKETFLRRRIDARMLSRQIGHYSEYASLLRKDGSEYDWLIKSLSINVTHFFRNRGVWDFFRDNIIPRLVNQISPKRSIKIWSAGCASGEEPYTIAIMFLEWAQNRKFHVYASDRSQTAIDNARSAIYKKSQFKEFPEQIKQKYLKSTADKEKQMLALDLFKDKITFAVNDIKDPPLFNLDVIFCRNVLIYFDQKAEIEIFHRFYEALRPNGFLVLGLDETMLTSMRQNSFIPFNTDLKIYQKVDT